jgi:hypothetical protein
MKGLDHTLGPPLESLSKSVISSSVVVEFTLTQAAILQASKLGMGGKDNINFHLLCLIYITEKQESNLWKGGIKANIMKKRSIQYLEN